VDLGRFYPNLTKMQKSVKIIRLPADQDEVTRLLSDGPSRTVKYLSVEAVRKVFEQIPSSNLRNRLLFDLIYHYGLRRQEECNLMLADLDLGAATIEIRRLKGGESKPYPFSCDKTPSFRLPRAYARELDLSFSEPSARR